jgi:uncharacterized protein (TIGR02246 family)
MVHDSENIQALLDAMSRDWNLHDAKAYSRAFSNEADFTDVFGISAFGRDSIEKMNETSFETVFKNSTLKITEKKIRYITNDVIAVDVRWELTGAQGRNGREVSPEKGLANLLLTRDDNNWLILIMHNMNLPD